MTVVTNKILDTDESVSCREIQLAYDLGQGLRNTCFKELFNDFKKNQITMCTISNNKKGIVA